MQPNRTRWRLLAAWLAVFCGFAAVAHGDFETTDAAFTMQAARALVMRGDSGLRLPEQGATSPAEIAAAAWIHAHEAEGARKDGKIGSNGLAYVWYPVGHLWLLVPFVALGEGLGAMAPGLEAAFRDRIAPGSDDRDLVRRLDFISATPVVTQSVIAVLLPPACLATTTLLLLLLAQRLGAGRADAARTALAIVLATQCFALGREQLSDGPGLTLMVALLLLVMPKPDGAASTGRTFAAGAVAGAAVLLRYQTAFVVLAALLALVLACRRRRDWRGLAAFAAGGLPFAALLLLVNWQRFGDPLVTGYPKADDWFDQPIWSGLPKILLGAGRGILWCSPLLWLALPLAFRRRAVPQQRWLAWTLFLTPVLMFAAARGWQGGQCWSVRYVTPGVVALLALVLPQALPWRRWPRTWLCLCGLGLFANVTSVVAPVRGVLQLAAQAVQAQLDHDVAAGRLDAAAAARVDAADVTGWAPRYSPFVANWRYALQSHVGGFELATGQPNDGSTATIEALFGIAAATPAQGLAPQRFEDRCARHLWWRFWGDLLGVSGLWLVLPLAAFTMLFAWFGWRPLLRPSGSSTVG